MNVGGMNQGMGPLQDKFVQNVQQQMGTLKTNKELQADERPLETEDKVELQSKEATAQEHLEAASHSGLISEFDPRAKRKEQKPKKGTDEVQVGSEKGNRFETKTAEKASEGKQGLAADEIKEAKVFKDAVNLETLFPKQNLEAANKIVMGQIQEKTPSPSLAELKAVPETAALEGVMKEYHPMMGIHDSGNKPIVMLGEATL